MGGELIKPQLLKQRIAGFFSDTNIVLLSACCIFLPYVLSGIFFAFFAFFVMINKRTRRLIFVHTGSKFLLPFFALALIVPVIYKNWIGVVGGIGMIVMLVFSLYLRSVMTRALFERMLTIVCVLSITSSIVAIIQEIVAFIMGVSKYRSMSVFFNPNYFGTIVSMVIIICAYKVLTRQGPQWVYYGIAAMNFVNVYLCGSLFVWVEIFIGVSMLLFSLRKHGLLVIFLLLAAFGCILLYFYPVLIPRLSESESTTELRVRIWKVSIQQIRKTPIFGQGVLTYYHIYKDYPGSWPTEHAHSIYLDPILNFGVVGTFFLLWYFVKYYIALFRQYFKRHKMIVPSLIIAITSSVLVHGTTDVTILWIQTGLLAILIMSGIGVGENAEKARKLNMEQAL